MQFPPVTQEIMSFQTKQKPHQNMSEMYLHMHCLCACGATHHFREFSI